MQFVTKKKNNESASDIGQVSVGVVGDKIVDMLTDEQTTLVSEEGTLQESYTLFNKKTGAKLTMTVPKGGVVKPLTLKSV